MELQLTQAYAQTIQDKDKNGWVVYNHKNERLAVLPQPCDEHTAMAAIHLGRDVEAAAYKQGLDIGKNLAIQATKQKIEELRLQKNFLEQENIRLSQTIQRLLGNEDEE